MLKRPIVLLSLICFSEIFSVLAVPDYFPAILCISLLLAVSSFIYYHKKKESATGLLCAFAILFSVINPYFSYTNNEKSVERFIDACRENESNTFHADVTEYTNYGSYSVIYANLTRVNGTDIDKNIKIRIGAYSAHSLEEGDSIVFEGTPNKLSEIKESDFDTSTHLRSKNIFMDFQNISLISSSAGEKSFIGKLRSYTKDVIYSFVPINYNFDEASLAYAMFAGDASFIPDNITQEFRFTGTTHIICVSGMHLTIIIGCIYLVLSRFTIHKNIKCILVISIAVFYTIFTGFSFATIRACIMCCITFLALLFGKSKDAYQSLFASILIICCFSPYSVFDISLILSFTATLGILVFSELRTKTKTENVFFKFLLTILDTITINLGAMLFTMPVCAYFFGGISVLSAPVTLIISYPAQLLLVFTTLLLLISPISAISFLTIIPEFFGYVCLGLSSFIIKVVRLFSHFKFGHVETDNTLPFLIIFLIILVILAIFVAFDFKRARFFCAITVIFFGMTFAFMALTHAITEDCEYKVNYYRKNEDDRQLGIKLGHEGYLIVNADSLISTIHYPYLFDEKYKENYLLLIPDESIEYDILSDSITKFRNEYGLKKIFVPQTQRGFTLANELLGRGIESEFMPDSSTFGSITLEYSCGEYEYISLYDGKTRTSIVFADCYYREFFKEKSDICAFFTRKTRNQFDISKDIAPDCDTFITRLGRGESADGIINTFAQKTFTIKG